MNEHQHQLATGRDLGTAMLEDPVAGAALMTAWERRPQHSTAAEALTASGVFDVEALAEGLFAAVEGLRFGIGPAYSSDSELKTTPQHRLCGGIDD